MPRLSDWTLIVCAGSVCLGHAEAQVRTHPDPTAAEVERGHHGSAMVVRLRPGFTLGDGGRFLSSASDSESIVSGASFQSLGVTRMDALLAGPPANPELASRLGLDRMYLVHFGEHKADMGAVVREALRSPAIESAEPVQLGQTLDLSSPPTDPLFSQQYSLMNTGQTVDGLPGLEGADINARRAWELSTGSGHVTIAVFDAGVSYAHPDLAPKIESARNTTGSGGVGDANDPFNSHGTHVAGIAAAASNNGEGMTGVSWGSRIMAVKVANPLGFTSDVWLGQGLIWAADNEARVGVVSLGLDTGSDFLHAAVQYATEQGMVICASTGNSGQPGVKYPAKYAETIAVGATDHLDRLAAFSTTGPEVTVVAPGVEILSTWDDFFGPPTYAEQSGTSVSTPLVAGMVALMLSENAELRTPEVIELLRFSVIDLGVPGPDSSFGLGRIDAYRAVGIAKGIRVCMADVNQNGVVDDADFSAWIAAYNRGDLLADQNGNGTIEPADFSAFIFNFIHGCQ